MMVMMMMMISITFHTVTNYETSDIEYPQEIHMNTLLFQYCLLNLTLRDKFASDTNNCFLFWWRNKRWLCSEVVAGRGCNFEGPSGFTSLLETTGCEGK